MERALRAAVDPPHEPDPSFIVSSDGSQPSGRSILGSAALPSACGGATSATGVVFDIRRFSIHDGPGIRTTVFLKGCPLRCWWCHNPEGLSSGPEMLWREERCIRCGACIEACDAHALTWNGQAPALDASKCDLCGACATECYAEAREILGRVMLAEDLVQEIERDRPFFDQSGGGVTFSGGEPLAQPEFLLEVLAKCRGRDIHTTLDTCGHAPWEVLDRIRPHVSLFLYDLKLVDDARHREFTGASNAEILRNLQALAALRHRISVRVPVIQGVNDDDRSVRALASFAAGLGHIEGLVLLPYHRLGAHKYAPLGREYRLPDVPTPSDDRIADIAATFRKFGLHVEVSG